MYKLIVLDCDGTLLNKDKEITPFTVSILKKIASKGVRIVLASARPYYRLVPFLEKIGTNNCNHYTISFNGGLVKNNKGSDVLFSKKFEAEDIKKIVSYGKSINSNIFLYSENAIISNYNDVEYKKKNPDANFITTDFDYLDFSEIGIYKIVFSNQPEVTMKIKSTFPIDLIRKFEITSSIPYFIEFVPKGVDKANAIEIISRKLKINRNNIIAFGDENNDIPMLKYAGFSVAMGNSPDEIKKIADYVTNSNNEDGVAKALIFLFKLYK